MSIKGIEGLSVAQVRDEVQRGGRFVVFTYAMSFLVITLKRGSEVHFIRAGEGTFGPSLPYTLLSFFIGWWGFPWGLIYTPMAIIQNLSGGTDVTAQVLGALELEPSYPSGGGPNVQVK